VFTRDLFESVVFDSLVFSLEPEATGLRHPPFSVEAEDTASSLLMLGAEPETVELRHLLFEFETESITSSPFDPDPKTTDVRILLFVFETEAIVFRLLPHHSTRILKLQTSGTYSSVLNRNLWVLGRDVPDIQYPVPNYVRSKNVL